MRLIIVLAIAAVFAFVRAKPHRPARPPSPSSWRRRITSHSGFRHTDIDSLGYDWERIGNPNIAPRHPSKVYRPQTVDELVAIVRQSHELGERLVVRSRGHSSNDLVVTSGPVILTEALNRILEIDTRAGLATIEAGAISAEIDDELARQGWGLPIIGDHNDITVGGFMSVGGISAGSHRHGMFIDQVERLDYVTWDGDLRTCSLTERPEEFRAALAGTGKLGIIVRATVRIVPVDKYGTVLWNDQQLYRDFDAFLQASREALLSSDEAVLKRGVWLSLANGRFGVGQFSAFRETEQTAARLIEIRLAYGFLHRLGYLGNHAPRRLAGLIKYLGALSIAFQPRYASIKNAEFFSDKVLDASVGDPTRMFILLPPMDAYEDVVRESYNFLDRLRQRTGSLTVILTYVKAINSPYLSRGGDQTFCELLYYVGIDPSRMTPAITDEIAQALDAIALRHGGFRYMHTRTSRNPDVRLRVDPNTEYAAKAGARDLVAGERVV